MTDVFAMDGNGGYVWAAYGITLVVLIWNILAARARLKRNLRSAAREGAAEKAPTRPKVREL
jgi:heme exporter protein CcmD